MTAATISPAWFGARRGLALGIILSGTGVSGLIWASALQASIDTIGFRNTLRLSGGVSLLILVIASIPLAWEPAPKAQIEIENASRTSRVAGIWKVPLINLRLLRSRKFMAQALSAILQAAAYYTPIFFFSSYAGALGYTSATGANITAVSNACNAVGKIVIGHAADRTGRLNLLLITTLISAASTAAFWLLPTLSKSNEVSRILFVALATLYGTFASAYVSLFPASLVQVFGLQDFASVNGFLYMVRGLASLVGTPTGGALIRGSGGGLLPKSYEGMALLTLVMLFAASMSVLWVRFEAMVMPDGRTHWRWKL